MYIDDNLDTLILAALRKGNWFFLYSCENGEFLSIPSEEVYRELKS